MNLQIKIVIIFTFIIPSTIFSQNTFFINWNTMNEVSTAGISEDNEGNLLISMTEFSTNNNLKQGELYLFSNHGYIINQRTYNSGDYSGITCLSKGIVNNTHLIGYYIDSILNGHMYHYMLIDEINNNFELIKTNIISNYCDTTGFIRKIIHFSDSSILIINDISSSS